MPALSFQHFVLLITDAALMVVYLAGVILAIQHLPYRRRASQLVLAAMFMLMFGKLATFSLALLARSSSVDAMNDIVAYVKMGNTVLLIAAIGCLLTATYAVDHPKRKAPHVLDQVGDGLPAAQNRADEQFSNPYAAPAESQSRPRSA